MKPANRDPEAFQLPDPDFAPEEVLLGDATLHPGYEKRQ